MALNLALSAVESTDRTTLTLTDITADWGVGGNINFNNVQYAEIYVAIRGALYGPVIFTSVFSTATSQSDLVFTITPQDLDLSITQFEDGLYDIYYGVSELATPPEITRSIWTLPTSYTLPTVSTENKIPFNFPISDAFRFTTLELTINLGFSDQAINPQIIFNVNYSDGTTDTLTQDVPKDETDHTYTMTINVDRTKEVKNISGELLAEDRANIAERQGTITNISLVIGDLNIISSVVRVLLTEKTDASLDRRFLEFQDDFLKGYHDLDRHERVTIQHLALESVINGADIGEIEKSERIINYLNRDSND